MGHSPDAREKKQLQGNRDHGAGLLEFTLLIALIAVVTIASVSALGQSATGKFATLAACTGGAGNDQCTIGQNDPPEL